MFVRVTLDFLEGGECVSILTSVVYLANHVENILGHLSPHLGNTHNYDPLITHNHAVTQTN